MPAGEAATTQSGEAPERLQHAGFMPGERIAHRGARRQAAMPGRGYRSRRPAGCSAAARCERERKRRALSPRATKSTASAGSACATSESIRGCASRRRERGSGNGTPALPKRRRAGVAPLRLAGSCWPSQVGIARPGDRGAIRHDQGRAAAAERAETKEPAAAAERQRETPMAHWPPAQHARAARSPASLPARRTPVTPGADAGQRDARRRARSREASCAQSGDELGAAAQREHLVDAPSGRRGRRR